MSTPDAVFLFWVGNTRCFQVDECRELIEYLKDDGGSLHSVYLLVGSHQTVSLAPNLALSTLEAVKLGDDPVAAFLQRANSLTASA
ncbi:MAG: hypothetical protein KBD21_04805 [Candidatus Pacebacteria bacterium]|nr:hypothetical protein [Candidatus Paceibacterota bacterium]